jgi:DNA-binding HxlR family transcriptional regulator
MTPFTFQQWKRKESEQRILDALSTCDRSFGELLGLTQLSKPILSTRLKDLEKDTKVKTVPDTKTKRFLYHLEYGKLNDVEKAHVLVDSLSKVTLDYLEELADNTSISDKEYSDKLAIGITALFNLKMNEMMMKPPPEQKEWLKTVMGPEFAERMPRLLENRDISSLLCKMSSGEQAIFKSKDAREAAAQLLKYVRRQTKKPPEV